MSSRRSQLVANLATAHMDSLQRSLYKATNPDQLLPKNKHVLAVLDFAAQHPSEGDHLGAEISRRLLLCAQGKGGASVAVGAKTMLVVHRLLCAGHAKALSTGGGVCGALKALVEAANRARGRGESSATEMEYLGEHAQYMQQLLCASEYAGGLHTGAAARACALLQLSSVMETLPVIQKLLALALGVAERIPPAQAALGAMRVAISADALSLYRCEAACVSRLQAALLSLPEHQVAAFPGGALHVLEQHAAAGWRVLALQNALANEADGPLPHDGIERALASLVWERDGKSLPTAATDDSSTDDGDDVFAGVPRRRLAQLAAERSVLMRHVLADLPRSARAELCGGATEPTEHALLSLDAGALLRSVAAQAQDGRQRLQLDGGAVHALTAGGGLDDEASEVHEASDLREASELRELLDPLPVAAPLLQPPLRYEMSEGDAVTAAYEALLLSLLPAASAAASAADSGSESEIVHVVRARLGITFRQHRRLALLLCGPEVEAEVRALGISRASPAHVALLLLHACTYSQARAAAAAAVEAERLADQRERHHERLGERRGSATASVSKRGERRRSVQQAAGEKGVEARRAHTVDTLSDGEAADFGRRQLLLLCNTLDVNRIPSVAIEQLKAQAERLLDRLDEPERAGCPEAVDSLLEASSEMLDGAAALRGTLIELRLLPAEGAPPQPPHATHWALSVALQMYSELLGAVFDVDSPNTFAVDRTRLLASYRRLSRWGAHQIGEEGEQLAMLTVCLERYHAEGGTQLLGAMLNSLEARKNCAANLSLAQLTSMVLAGVAASLASRLRDYRVRFALDVEEMSLCVQLWRGAVLQLQPRASSFDEQPDLSAGALPGALSGARQLGVGAPSASLSATQIAASSAQAALEEQAQAVIDTSVQRTMRRLRRTRLDAVRADGGGEERTVASVSARLATLAELVCEELEAERLFAASFDVCVLDEPAGSEDDDAHRAAGAGGGGSHGASIVSVGVDCGDGIEGGFGLRTAIAAYAREVGRELQRALGVFTTIEGYGLSAVRALAPLAELVRRECGSGALPEYQQLGEQMAAGWMTQLRAELRGSLEGAVRLEAWAPVSEVSRHTSSVVDVFSQLDQLVVLYADFAPPLQLKRETHERFCELVEGQVREYVQTLVSTCAPLPGSVLQAWDGGCSSNGVAAAAGRQARQRSPGCVWASAKASTGAAPSEGLALVPVAHSRALDDQPLVQLCLRLNNISLANGQLSALWQKLSGATTVAEEVTCGRSTSWVDAACRDLVDYIAAKQVYYEMEERLLVQLYRPSPHAPGARIAPLLEEGLHPVLRVIVGLAEAPWLQPLVMGVLGAVTQAVGSVLQMPRGYAAEHRLLLEEDLQQLCAFFQDGRILDEELVTSSVQPLRLLADEACDHGPAHHGQV